MIPLPVRRRRRAGAVARKFEKTSKTAGAQRAGIGSSHATMAVK
jgi:hypothetical protein